MIARFTLLMVFSALLTSKIVVFAEEPHSNVCIKLRDSVSGASISFTHVRLLADDIHYDGFTDKDGDVCFNAPKPRIYGVIIDSTVETFQAASANVRGDSALNLTLLGIRSGLRIIGRSESSRTSERNYSRSLDENDPAPLISGSVPAAISSIPNLALGEDGVSIRGQGAGSTGVSINGVPVFAGNSIASQTLLGSDIFSSADVTEQAVGSPSGALDLHTFDPTIAFNALFQERAASDNSSITTFRGRGTAGRVGFAASAFHSTDGGDLDSIPYVSATDMGDQLRFHRQIDSEAVTLRYGSSEKNTFFADFGEARLDNPRPCSIISQYQSCGFGTDSRSLSSTQFLILRDDNYSAHSALHVSLFSSTQALRSVVGSIDPASIPPSQSLLNQSRIGATAALTLQLAPSETLTLNISAFHDNESVPDFTSFDSAANNGFTTSRFEISHPFKISPRFSNSLSLGYDRIGDTSHITSSFSSEYLLNNSLSIDMIARSGQLAHGIQGSSNLLDDLDPRLTDIDCSSNSVRGVGPTVGLQSASPSENLSIAINRGGPRSNVRAEAFFSRVVGGAVSSLLPAHNSPLLQNPQYFDDVSALENKACGNFDRLNPDGLVLSAYGQAQSVISNGFDVSNRINVGGRSVLTLAVETKHVSAFGDGLLFRNSLDLRSGEMLPSVPSLRGDVAFSMAAGLSNEIIAASHFSSETISPSVPGQMTWDLGLRTKTKKSDLIFGIQNIFNAEARPLQFFSPFPYLTATNAPRTFSARLRIAVGRPSIDSVPLLAPAPFTGNVFAFDPLPYDSSNTLDDRLEANTTSSKCGPENLPVANDYLQRIRAYVIRVAEARRADPNLATYPKGYARDLELSFIPTDSSYFIRLRAPQRALRQFDSLTRCAKIHFGSYSDSTSRNLFIPGWQEREAFPVQLFFSDREGFYFPPNSLDGTRLNLPSESQVKADASNQFAVSDQFCPETYKAVAQFEIGILRNYINAVFGGQKANVPDGFLIVRHNATATPWLDIRADTNALGNALFTCVHGTVRTQNELEKLGLAGSYSPSFDYAPSLGFYRTRPNFK